MSNSNKKKSKSELKLKIFVTIFKKEKRFCLLFVKCNRNNEKKKKTSDT